MAYRVACAFVVTLTVCLPIHRASAQSNDSLQAVVRDVIVLRDSLREAKSTFRFGLSVGPRVIAFETSSILERRKASISPNDSTLHFERVDRFEMALAGVVSAYPWAGSDGPLENVGFLAKLNLADFGPNSFIVNRVIQGGLGFSYSFSRDFAVGITLERVTGRRVRSNFREGRKIRTVRGVVTELDISNSNIFVNDNYTALSIAWVYSF